MFPTARSEVPWSKGAFVGPKPPLKLKPVWSIRSTLQREGRIRDLALFDLAIDSKLRGCDLVQLHTGQLFINARSLAPRDDRAAEDREAARPHQT